MRSRTWVFTINNPSPEDYLSLKNLNRLKLLLACLERGENGTLHYQGYVELELQTTLSALKNRIPRAHLEVRRGSRDQAIKYCIKDQPIELIDSVNQVQGWHCSLTENETGLSSFVLFQKEPYSLTKMEQKVTRAEALKTMKSMIDNGKHDTELAEYNFPVYISCFRGLQHYRVLTSKPRDHEVEVIVIQGPTGTGKSKFCKDTYPDAYWKQRSNWWDGYSNHSVVIIDEFYGWLPFDLLLRICDRYPLLVETKGGQVNFVARQIIITTNALPDRWYKNVYFKSFIRRVSKWTVMPIWGSTISYLDYKQALPNMIDNDFNT